MFDDMLTTIPCPFKLTLITLSSLFFMRKINVSSVIPALLTKISIWPNWQLFINKFSASFKISYIGLYGISFSPNSSTKLWALALLNCN